MIIFCQFHRHMLTVCWRPLTDIHGNIQHSTLHASHQLALCKRRSQEMQATHYTIRTHTLIVLAELYLVAHQWLYLLFKLSLAEALEEVTTSISKKARLNNEHAFNICIFLFITKKFKLLYIMHILKCKFYNKWRISITIRILIFIANNYLLLYI